MRCAAAVSLVVGVLMVSPANAQKTTTTPPQTEFTGCVSGERTPSGTFTLTETQSGGKYRLTGKKMERYAGKMVAIVSGPSKRVAVSGGLWPSPNTAAQAGGLDPAQESISRQPGGGAKGDASLALPELHVVRIRTIDGACR
jgi:hypothetical protein